MDTLRPQSRYMTLRKLQTSLGLHVLGCKTGENGSCRPHGLPRWLSSKENACQCRRRRLDPWVEKIPWRRKWQPTLVFLPGKSHGQKSLAGYSPRGAKESTQLSNST